MDFLGQQLLILIVKRMKTHSMVTIVIFLESPDPEDNFKYLQRHQIILRTHFRGIFSKKHLKKRLSLHFGGGFIGKSPKLI